MNYMKALKTIVKCVETVAECVGSDILDTTQHHEEEKNETGCYAVIMVNATSAAIHTISTIRQLTGYDFEEAKGITKLAHTIINFYPTKEEAEQICAKYKYYGIETIVKKMEKSNFSFDNIFRIDKAFSTAERGVAVTGINYRNIMKKNETVCLVKKDGRVLKTSIKEIEEFNHMLEETTVGKSAGLLLTNMKKEDVESGDVLVGITIFEKNRSKTLADDACGAYKGNIMITKDGRFPINSVIEMLINDGWTTDKPDYEKSKVVRLTGPDLCGDMTVINLPGNRSYIVSKRADYLGDKPNMTWSGLSWGASPEEFIKIYGEPVRSDHEAWYSDDYTFVIQKGIQLKASFNKSDRGPLGLDMVTVCAE